MDEPRSGTRSLILVSPNSTILPLLPSILQDEDVVRQVIEAAKTSMGMDISAHDLSNVELFTR